METSIRRVASGAGWVVELRIVHVIFALCVAASAVEMADRSGLGGEQSALASTAEAMRTVRSADLPTGSLDEFRELSRYVRRIAGSLDQVAEELDKPSR